MSRIPLTERVHRRLAECVSAGDIAIDATAGNGHDTLFLAECVGESGCVYSFDIQPQAIEETSKRLLEAGCAERVRLIQAGHERMQEYIAAERHGNIAAIVFNLGYLPGTDKSCVTTHATTLQALSAAAGLLKADGIISVLAYPGHPGGREETEAVKAWAETLAGSRFEVSIHPPQHANGKSPEWIEIRKRDKSIN